MSKKKTNNRNYYNAIKTSMAIILSLEIIFIGKYVWDTIKDVSLFDEDLIYCSLIICICLCFFLQRFMSITLQNKLNYKEYAEFLQKQIKQRSRVHLKSLRLQDELHANDFVMGVNKESNDNISNRKIQEYVKRYIAEDFIVKEELKNASNVLASIDINIHDYRDDYLNLIVVEKYEEAIKCIDSKKNIYRSAAVINSFWKGFCLNMLGKREEAMKEFGYCKNNGGDSKYKIQSEIYIEQLKRDYDCQTYDISEEKKQIKVDKVYKDINLWIYLLIILVVVMIQLFV